MCECAVCKYLDRESESLYLHTTNWNSCCLDTLCDCYFSSSGKTSCTCCFAALWSHNVAVQVSILRVSSWSAVFVLICLFGVLIYICSQLVVDYEMVCSVVHHSCFTCIVFQLYVKTLHYTASLILQAMQNPIYSFIALLKSAYSPHDLKNYLLMQF